MEYVRVLVSALTSMFPYSYHLYSFSNFSGVNNEQVVLGHVGDEKGSFQRVFDKRSSWYVMMYTRSLRCLVSWKRA
jgi:hypothetical protein